MATKQISVRVEIKWLERIKTLLENVPWELDTSDYVRQALIEKIQRDEDATNIR